MIHFDTNLKYFELHSLSQEVLIYRNQITKLPIINADCSIRGIDRDFLCCLRIYSLSCMSFTNLDIFRIAMEAKTQKEFYSRCLTLWYKLALHSKLWSLTLSPLPPLPDGWAGWLINAIKHAQRGATMLVSPLGSNFPWRDIITKGTQRRPHLYQIILSQGRLAYQDRAIVQYPYCINITDDSQILKSLMVVVRNLSMNGFTKNHGPKSTFSF